jgi:hypothetical protein
MNIASSLSRWSAAFGFALSLASAPALAAPTVVNEAGDAGDTLATAQDARLPSPYELLLRGALSNEPATLDLVDMFRLNIDRSFIGAHTGDGSNTSLVADPVLFVFDAFGVGVAMDDESGGFGQALIGSIGSGRGEFYVAIAFAGMEPLDANGDPIFDSFGSGAVLSALPLSSWGGSPFALNPGIIGDYDLSVAVPLPASVALAGLGLMLMRIGRSRRR